MVPIGDVNERTQILLSPFYGQRYDGFLVVDTELAAGSDGEAVDGGETARNFGGGEDGEGFTDWQDVAVV